MAIKEKAGDKKGIAMSLGNIGILHKDKGDLDKALEYHDRSLEIKENIGDKSGIAMSLNNIGEVSLYKDDLDKAREYYKRALDIGLEIGFKQLLPHANSGLAEANLGLGDAQKALEYAEKVYEISVEIGAKTEEGMGRRLLGMVYREKRDWEAAIEEFERAKVIFEDTEKIDPLARVFSEYGLMWKAKGEPAKAKEYLEKALSMFEDMGMKLWEEKCRMALEEL